MNTSWNDLLLTFYKHKCPCHKYFPSCPDNNVPIIQSNGKGKEKRMKFDEQFYKPSVVNLIRMDIKPWLTAASTTASTSNAIPEKKTLEQSKLKDKPKSTIKKPLKPVKKCYGDENDLVNKKGIKHGLNKTKQVKKHKNEDNIETSRGLGSFLVKNNTLLHDPKEINTAYANLQQLDGGNNSACSQFAETLFFKYCTSEGSTAYQSDQDAGAKKKKKRTLLSMSYYNSMLD